MKIKIEMPQRWKKYFTLGDMEEIKRIKAEPELENDINTALEIAAAGGEILKATAEWGYNHAEPEDTYYGNGVEISFTVYVLHEYSRFEIINATMQELLCKTINQDRTGYGQIYKFSDTFKDAKYR